MTTAIVIGASGGIGGAVVKKFAASGIDVVAVSRHAPQERLPSSVEWLQMPSDLTSLDHWLASKPLVDRAVRYVVCCHGVLHTDAWQPEKQLKQLNEKQWLESMRVNALMPLLWLQQLAQHLPRDSVLTFLSLSARVGSIGDNRLGGWYSYRASKAALNMGLKSAAAELKRSHRAWKLVAFHPGTTDTPLSEPFQSNVPSDKLFTPDFVAEALYHQITGAKADGELSFIDYAGKVIDW